MPTFTPEFGFPDPTREAFEWPNRDSDSATVVARLESKRHIHIEAPPGYGKDALVVALSEALGDRATVTWLAHEPTGDPDPNLRLARAIDPALGIAVSDCETRDVWSAIVAHFAAMGTGERVLIIAGADHLIPVAPDRFELPPELTSQVRLVTVSIAPLSTILQDLAPADAEARTLRLLAYPSPSDSFDLSDRPAQEEADYTTDGNAWFANYLAQHDEAADNQALRRIFEIKHLRRIGELWQGHPLVNVAALSAMLGSVREGGRADAALEDFRANLPRLHVGALHDRLLPFRPGAIGAVSATVCLAIAQALEAWIDAGERASALAPVQRDWLVASGLCRVDREGSAIAWADANALIGGPEGALQWARGLRGTAATAIARQADQARRRCPGLGVAQDLLEQKLESELKSDEFEVRFTRRPEIVEIDRLYQFHLEERGPVGRDNRDTGPHREFDVLVFEDRAGADLYWRHQIRILSMLGRMRHPALLPFRRGGQLLDPLGLGGDSEFHYIEIDRTVHLSSRDQAHLLVELINPPRSAVQVDGEPNPAFAQIVRLAEAIDLIHAQGIIHRSIDFRAIELLDPDTAPQLVLTGFEFAANVRSEVAHSTSGNSSGRVSPREGTTPWDFACRAPTWRPLHADVVDPSLDVYAFGALAAMILTGLPVTSLDAGVLDCLSDRSAELSSEDSLRADETIARALNDLHLDLRGEDRWAGVDPRAADINAILRDCLNRDSERRPQMEDVARLLRARHEEYLAAFVRSSEELHVSYPEEQMGKMLKHLQLVAEDQDITTGEGVQWLRRRIEEWVGAAKWMHFRADGFPRKGQDKFERTRRDSQFIIAGPAVTFFASIYRRFPDTANEQLDPRVLWLTYAVRRNELLLPDPDNPDQVVRRSTTEEVSWIPKPGLVRTIRSADVGDLPAGAASWDPTLNQLRQRGRGTSERRLGREAALAWRTHLDIVRAHDRIRNFPVLIERLGNYRFALSLDLARFRRENEAGSKGFLRAAILGGRNEQAFFLDTIQQQVERSGENRHDFLLSLGGRGRAASARRVVGTLRLPIREGKVEFTVDQADEHGIAEFGRMGWFDSIGTDVAAERQSSAIERLERRSWMMQSLAKPENRSNHRWATPVHTALLLGNASTESLDDFNTRLQDMLSSDPLHAVQGPPGTGKTTLIAALVAEILANNDGSRILVTSQSHAATDNVLMAVMRALETIEQEHTELRGETRPLVALRLFSESTRELVDPAVQRRYSINAQIREARGRMLAEANARIEATGKTDKASKYLKRAAEHGYLEVRLALERSAPLIFATTGAAMTSLDYLRRGTIGYDYVLIDEAAKAWAIDLVQPLAMADRAILVGDQNQLPPFGDIELDEFMVQAKLRAEKHEAPLDLAELLDTTRGADGHETPSDRMNNWLKLFHRTFEKAPRLGAAAGSNRNPVVQSLNKQFRSVSAIGSLVSETFYPEIGIRNAGPEPDLERRMRIPLRSGKPDLQPALAWIDTSGLEASKYFTKRDGSAGLTNPGEADLLRQLLSGLDLGDESKPAERLRVLSPYKKQIGLIRNECQKINHGIDFELFEQIFQTADSAQGSEADVVVVSLCRRLEISTQTALPVGASQALRRADLKRRINELMGFMQLPQRLNVILSRPRQQLVLIGDFAYFQAGSRLLDAYAELIHGDEAAPGFWQRLLEHFAPLDEGNPPTGKQLELPIVLRADQLRLTL